MHRKSLIIVLALVCLVSIGGRAEAQTPGTVKWFFPTGVMDRSSPAIGADGTVYAGSNDKKFYAINPDGTLKWRYDSAVNFNASPAIGRDGTIYIGAWYHLYAFKPDGSVKWMYYTNANLPSSPALASDGTIYLGVESKILAIRDNGASAAKKWDFTAGAGVAPEIAVGSAGTIYVKEYGNNLYAVNPDGSLKWSITLAGNISGSSAPAIGPDNVIYVGAFDGKLYAIQDNGANASEKWAFDTEGGAIHNCSPAIGPDGVIYVGSWITAQKLFAVNPDGSQKWAYTATNGFLVCPVIGANGIIYVVNEIMQAYALYPADGAEKWVGDPIIAMNMGSSPAMGPDGTIYVGSSGGSASGLRAISGDATKLAETNWPMYHHDLRHTGNLRGPQPPPSRISSFLNLLLAN